MREKFAEIFELPDTKGLPTDEQFFAVSTRLEQCITLYAALDAASFQDRVDVGLDILCGFRSIQDHCETVLEAQRLALIAAVEFPDATRCGVIAGTSTHDLIHRLLKDVVQTCWARACAEQFAGSPEEVVRNAISIPADPRPRWSAHWDVVADSLKLLPQIEVETCETAIQRERVSVLSKIAPRWSKPRSPSEWVKRLNEQGIEDISERTFQRRCKDGTYRKKPGGTTKRVSLDLRDLGNFDDSR